MDVDKDHVNHGLGASCVGASLVQLGAFLAQQGFIVGIYLSWVKREM